MGVCFKGLTNLDKFHDIDASFAAFVFPGVGIFRLLGYLPVVANVEFLDRRGVVIEQAFRRLGDQRPLAEHDEPFVLAGKLQILRSLGRGGLFAYRTSNTAKYVSAAMPAAAGMVITQA
jgi:hypothetical protein